MALHAHNKKDKARIRKAKQTGKKVAGLKVKKKGT